MDNTNPLTSVSLQSNSDSGAFSNSGSSSGFFGFLSNISGITWIAIILILAFLGFNVFVYLAKGTQDIANFFDPILKKVFGITLIVAGGAVDLTAEGAKTVVNTTADVVDATADVVDAGLTKIQELTPEGHKAKSSVPASPPQGTTQSPNANGSNSLNNTLNTKQGQPNEYQADEAKSSVHSTGQSGWCYIGEDRGYRTCTQVGPSDQCMSGDIFPSQEICINPNLRP